MQKSRLNLIQSSIKEEADDSHGSFEVAASGWKANEELIKVLAERFELPKSKNQN